MTRSCFLFIIVLAVQLNAVFGLANASDLEKANFSVVYNQQENHSGTHSVHGPEGLLLGLGWNAEHGGQLNARFHHEEDGHLHGFCFDRLNRRSWFRRISCVLLKSVLVLIHLALILVAFLHILH